MSNVLRNNHIKSTVQREAIYNYFLLNNTCLMKNIISDNKSIDQSTIYRIIDLFCEKHIIIKIIQSEKTFFKLNTNLHKHFIECIVCHHMEEIDVCPYNLIDLKGYKICSDNKIIAGICKNCQGENL